MSKSRAAVSAWVLIAVALATPPSVAQTWTGAAGTNWNTAGDWNPATIPNSPTADVVFGATGAGTVNIASSVQARSLTFDSVGAGAYTVTSSANQVLIGVSAITLTGPVVSTQTLNLSNVATGNLLIPGTGAAALTIDNRAVATAFPTLFLGPNTVLARTGTGVPGITVLGSGTTQISGTIASSMGGGLTMNGPGKLVIAGLEAGDGGTTLNAGTLVLDYAASASSRLPNGSFTSAGGDLLIQSNATTAFPETVTVTSLTGGHTGVQFNTANGALAGLSLGLGAVIRSAGSTLGVTLQSGGTLTTSITTTNGILGGWATVGPSDWATKSGSNIVALAAYGADLYAPGTNTDVSVGTGVPAGFTTNSLRFNTAVPGGLTMFLANATHTIQSGGILVGSSSGDVTVQGGTLSVPGANGELIVHNNSAGGLTLNATIVASKGLTKTGTGTLTLGGSTLAVDGSVNVNGGDLRLTATGAFTPLLSIHFNDNRAGAHQRLTTEFGDGVTVAASVPIRLNAGGTDPQATTLANTIANDSPNSRVTLTGAISSPAGTVTTLAIKSAPGAGFNLTGNNTFTGAIRLSGGFLGIDANASLGNAANTLFLAMNSANYTSGGLEFLNDGIDVSRPINLTGMSRVLSNRTDVNTISGVISGISNIVKAGTGTLELTGANTWGGSLFVDDGTLRVASAANMGNGSLFGVGGTGVLAVMDNLTTDRTLLLGLSTGGGGTGTLDVAAGKTLTLTGQATEILAVGTLIKTGPGALVLSNTTSNYTGGTLVRQGIVQVAANASLGASTATVTVESLGALAFIGSTTSGRTFDLTTGSLSVASGQTLTLSGATVGGGFLRGPGTLALTGGTSLTGSNTASGLVINQTGAASVANFTNNGQFTNAAGQTLTWSNGTNTSAGRLTVNGTANVSEFVSDGTITVNPGGTINNSLVPMVLGGGSTTTLGSAAAPGGTINLGGQTLELRGGLLTNFGTIGGGTVHVSFGGLVAGTGGIAATVELQPGGAFASGVTLANAPPASPASSAAIFALDPNQTTAANILLGADTTATVTAGAGTLTFIAPLVGPGRTLTKVGGGTLATASVRTGGLAVNEGTVRILPSGGSSAATSTLDALSVGGSGRLDLTDNKLVVHGGDLAVITALVTSGYHGGAWDGPGIGTSVATPSNALGVSPVGTPGYTGTNFGGVPVAAGDVLVMFTLGGDATLDGAVGFADLLALARNYNSTGRGWFQGDFDYNGQVNFSDLLTLARNYNRALPTPPLPAGTTGDFARDMATAFEVARVPEPAVVGVAVVSLGRWSMRRNRRRGHVKGTRASGALS